MQKFVYNLLDVQSIRELNSDPLAPSCIKQDDTILTQGYSNPNDGGGAYYRVENNTSSNDNGGNIIRIDSNRVAVLIPDENLNVKQFGALGDQTAQDSISIQNAIDYCLANGITQLNVPEGVYLISSSLVISNTVASSNQRPAGLYLKGIGASGSIDSTNPPTNATVFMADDTAPERTLSGPMLDIQGLFFDGSSFIASTYMNGGGIEGISFFGKGLGDTENHAIKILAWWNATIKNCNMDNFNGDGIHQLADLSFNPNPDFSASNNLTYKNLIISRVSGYGFNNSVFQSAGGSIFEQCVFTFCKNGGVFIQSSSCRFTNCSFSGGGWRESGDNNSGAAYGINFGGTSLTPNSRHIVEGCEFDTNLTAHISSSWLANSRISNNRFIHGARYNEGMNPPVLRPNDAVIFAPNSNDESSRNVEFISNFVRVDSEGTLNVFRWANHANVINILAEKTLITNAPNANLTVYEAYDFNNYNIRNNYVLDDTEQGIAGAHVISKGTPSPFYLGSTSNTPSGAVGPNFVALPFEIAGVSFLPNNTYNTTTGVFTCPKTGFYNVNVFFTITGLGSGVLFRTELRKTVGATTQSVNFNYLFGTGAVRQNLGLNARVFANEGDQLSIIINSQGTFGIEPTSGFNQLLIELV